MGVKDEEEKGLKRAGDMLAKENVYSKRLLVRHTGRPHRNLALPA